LLKLRNATQGLGLQGDLRAGSWKIDFIEMRCESLDRIHQADDTDHCSMTLVTITVVPSYLKMTLDTSGGTVTLTKGQRDMERCWLFRN